MSEYPSVDEIIAAIEDSFAKHPKIDMITVTANGEPTLYPHLNELIQRINEIKKEAKTLILSNGSTVYKQEVFEALLQFDTVKLSLDCVSEKCFKKLDRIHEGIDIHKMIEAMITFSQTTSKQFVLEVLFVKDLNDKDEEINLLYETIQRIKPHRVDIGTIDRPPAYKVQGVSFEVLEHVANVFKGVNVNIAYKNRPKQCNAYSEEEIKSLLTRRPLTQEDIENMFDETAQKTLDKLIKDRVISLVDSGGLNFYKIL